MEMADTKYRCTTLRESGTVTWPLCDATRRRDRDEGRLPLASSGRSETTSRPRVLASRGDGSSCHLVTPSMSDRRRRRVRTRTNASLNTPTCAARCRLDARDRLAAGHRVRRASPCLRAAGASVRSRDVCPLDAIGLPHPLDSHRHTIRSCETHDEVPLACAGRSVWRDGQRRLGRVRPHRVCGVGVPSSARPGHGGEPA